MGLAFSLGKMMNHQDKGKLEIVTWPQIRNEVAEIKPDFAKAVDALSINDEHYFVKCTYPFASKVLNKAMLMIPAGVDGALIPLNDPGVDARIKDALSYNLNSNPVSMILKNSFELYLPLADRTIPLNGLMGPGTIFGTFRVLNSSGSFQPKFIWDMTAGARSMFMLPRISESTRHMKIKKYFDLRAEKPTTAMSHWQVFKELSRHPEFPQSWDAEILFFSKKWFDHLDDKEWVNFYYQFYRSIWSGTEFLRNQPIWSLIHSLILQHYEGRPSAYVCDTVKYLIHVGIGAQPGFAPARNNSAGPIEGLQKVYKEEYEIRNYLPIIMCPERFRMNKAGTPPVYYSLQFPTAIEFGKSTRARTSLISDLHDIRSLLIRYSSEILSNQYQTDGTPIHEMFGLVEFDYFHNNVDLHSGMRSSKEMANGDNGLLTTLDGETCSEFPDMCSFVKDCIRLSHKGESR